jgi:amidase
LKPTRGRELGSGGGRRGGDNEALFIANDLCLSRSVRDTAAFLNAVENKNNPNLSPVGFVAAPSKKRLKIALVPEAFNGKKPHPEVEKAVRQSAQTCDKLGHRVEETKLEINGSEFIDAFLGFWATGALGLESLVEALLGKGTKREDVLEPWTIGLIELAKSRGRDACVQRAMKVFGEVTASLEKTFRAYDVILSPVMRVPPYKIGWHAPTVSFDTLLARLIDEVGYTPVHNAAGTPAMSAPLYWTGEGLPIGSQFAAWRGGEATLLELAYELEAAQPWARKRPTIFAS